MEKINTEFSFQGDLRFDEPLSSHTTFRVGGPADVWVRPSGKGAPDYFAALLRAARAEDVPVFILGGGANIVPSDRGVRGIVLDLGAWAGCDFSDEGIVEIRAGTTVDDAVESCAARGRGCLEFLAGMPGSVGGAVWMNARCYGRSVSDLLLETCILDESGRPVRVPAKADEFAYKKSPFQSRDILILTASFHTVPAAEEELRARMAELRADREFKGHYRLPSAGSVFKNDYAYGVPTGRIVDELGLRGLCLGGARVADWHGNIIVNTGAATAADIRALSEEVARRVKKARGLALECEILFVGDWA